MAQCLVFYVDHRDSDHKDSWDAWGRPVADDEQVNDIINDDINKMEYFNYLNEEVPGFEVASKTKMIDEKTGKVDKIVCFIRTNKQ